MIYDEVQPPAVGTPVTIIHGERQGEKGTVYGHKDGLVWVRVGGKALGVGPRDLQWIRIMPPIGITVRVNYIKGIEGMSGVVQGYTHLSTQHVTDTEQGWHYGLLVVVVDIENIGPTPFLPDNLLWNRSEESVLSEPEASPLPPAGVPHGKLSSTQLTLIHNRICEQQIPKPTQVYETRTALYQLKLPPYKSRLAARVGPSITEPLHSHIRSGDVVSFILPQPSSRVPDWWELSDGGWIKKNIEEWIALVMSCSVCGTTLPTEQALKSHFKAEHPEGEFNISVSGAFPMDDSVEHPLQQRNYRNEEQQLQLMQRSIPSRNTPEGPAWFVMEKPRRGFHLEA